MDRLMNRPALLIAAILVLLCLPVAAQDQDASTPQPRVTLKAERPLIFSPGGEQLSAAPVELIAYDRMSEQDRNLAADAESSIGERAGVDGLEFNQGQWSYRQILCSALPHHLFLQFTRNNGVGDVSVFSASIPRGSEGRVRIVPIQRRGYSLFSPAPINALTISAFNHIRSEERPAQAPQWLATGLCYAALAGARPQLGPAEQSDPAKLPSAPPGRLVISADGAVISFLDIALPQWPMQWTMSFDGKGKLLKASHAPTSKPPHGAVKTHPVEVPGVIVQHHP